jgi:hypothetical protein
MSQTKAGIGAQSERSRAKASAKGAQAMRDRAGRVKRHRGHPCTSDVDYTPDEAEFLGAVDRFRRERGRPFPTLCELLAVARELGYRKPPGGA